MNTLGDFEKKNSEESNDKLSENSREESDGESKSSCFAVSEKDCDEDKPVVIDFNNMFDGFLRKEREEREEREESEVSEVSEENEESEVSEESEGIDFLKLLKTKYDFEESNVGNLFSTMMNLTGSKSGLSSDKVKIFLELIKLFLEFVKTASSKSSNKPTVLNIENRPNLVIEHRITFG